MESGVAIVSSSGSVLFNYSVNQRSVGAAVMIGLGNQAVCDFSDFIDVLADDERITAIGLFIEDPRDILSFSAAAAKALARPVPVVALKTGASETGALVASTHSGALAARAGRDPQDGHDHVHPEGTADGRSDQFRGREGARGRCRRGQGHGARATFDGSTLFAFRPEYLEERHPPMLPTQTVVAGYSWGYMLEDPKDTALAGVDIDPMMSLDAEVDIDLSCTRRDGSPVPLGWATFAAPR